MRIAEFKNIERNYTIVQNEDFEAVDGYVRQTKYVDIAFTPREQVDCIAEEVSLIDEAADKLRTEFGIQIDNLKRRKEELLALTHQGE